MPPPPLPRQVFPCAQSLTRAAVSAQSLTAAIESTAESQLVHHRRSLAAVGSAGGAQCQAPQHISVAQHQHGVNPSDQQQHASDAEAAQEHIADVEVAAAIPNSVPEAPLQPPAGELPQPGTRRFRRPKISVKRALERVRARSTTPSTGDIASGATHPQTVQQPQTAVASTAEAEPAVPSPAALAPDPEPLRLGQGRPENAALVAQSDPDKRLCQNERVVDGASSASGAALPEHSHISATPAQTCRTTPAHTGTLLWAAARRSGCNPMLLCNQMILCRGILDRF